ncbi:uncharacterized protein TrAFT101_008053 [Trichoderma asperellum]|uniref:uncharacterized protein n=1 Tax=Trichoderma asperellum TaxID=101201 RepID=UPI003316DB95|nr:hypothetical protein TrAFT101_008053 [Trichoderma asperellum]
MTWFSWHTACCYYPIKGTYVFNRSYLKYLFTLFPVLQKAAWIHYKKKILHVCSLVWVSDSKMVNTKQTSQRREQQKAEGQRRAQKEAEKRQAEQRRAQREAEKKQAEKRRAQKEAEKRQAEQRRAQREAEKRQAEKRQAEKRQAEKRQAEKRQAEKRQAEKRQAQKEAEKRQAQQRRAGPQRPAQSSFSVKKDGGRLMLVAKLSSESLKKLNFRR